MMFYKKILYLLQDSIYFQKTGFLSLRMDPWCPKCPNGWGDSLSTKFVFLLVWITGLAMDPIQKCQSVYHTSLHVDASPVMFSYLLLIKCKITGQLSFMRLWYHIIRVSWEALYSLDDNLHSLSKWGPWRILKSTHCRESNQNIFFKKCRHIL